MEIIRRLANHARSLLHDVDSNVVEHYNSIVAKFIGGKRINYAFKNSYSARCYAAVVSHNTSMAHTFFKKVLLPHSKHGQIISRIESRRKMKCSRRKTMTKRKTFAPKTSKMNTRQPDKDYGYECQKADMDPETFQFAAAEFLENLQRSEQEKIQLEEKTRLQDENGLWMEERRKLVTASNFAKICKRKKNRDTSKLVQNILYSSRNLGNIASIRHGKDHEDEAITVLENVEKIKIKKCGIFIHKRYPFIGASPDGLVGDDTIVEIKCPYATFKSEMTIEEAIIAKKITFWRCNKNREIEINRKHDWFFQVQGQLHVTDRKQCILFVWAGKSFKLEYIQRDEEFWSSQMETNLLEFYKKALLPELVDPKRTRNLPLRNIIL